MNPSFEKVELMDFVNIRVPKSEIESGDINPTLRQLNQLRTGAASARRYADSLTFEIDGYDTSRDLFDIRDVQKFMAKLDKEFPYWFYFLSKSDASLDFILLSVCPHYRDSSTGKPRVQRDTFQNFMAEHHAAFREMCSLAELTERDSEQLTDEINTYFGNGFDLWYQPDAT
jgi:hypothetical protein